MERPLCRICLKPAYRPKKMASMDEAYEDETFATMYVTVTGYAVEDDEPQLLCEFCKSQLITAFKFRKKCKDTQETLRKTAKTNRAKVLKAAVKGDHNYSGAVVETVEIKQEVEEEEHVENVETIETLEVFDPFTKEDLNGDAAKTEDFDWCQPMEYEELEMDENGRVLYMADDAEEEDSFKAEENSDIQETEPQTNDTKIEEPDDADMDASDTENSSKICRHCGRPQKNLATLKHHLDRFHKEFLNVECRHCHRIFYSETYEVHRFKCNKQPSKGKSKKYKCQYCDQRFFTMTPFRVHLMQNHMDQKNVPCQHCGCLTFAELVNHHENRCAKNPDVYDRSKDETSLGMTKAMCPVCGKMICRLGLENHIANKHSEKEVFTCHFCEATSVNKNSLQRHIKTFHFPHQNPCNVCQASFKNYRLMAGHRRREHPELYPPLKCTKCDFTSANVTTIREHTKRHLGDAGKKYDCRECGHKFYNLHSLKKHMISHSEQRDVSCDECGNRYKSEHDLRKHKGFVHSEKGYECPVCRRPFGTNQNMRLHCSKNHPEYDLPPPGTVMKKNPQKFAGAFLAPLHVKLDMKAKQRGKRVG